MIALKELATTPIKNNGIVIKTTPTVEAKIASIIPKVKVENEKLQSLDDRLHRLNQLFEIQGKYNRLQISLQKLKSFSLNKEEYAGISITDDKRNDFSTKNLEITAEVVKFIIVTIERKIKEIQPLLVW